MADDKRNLDHITSGARPLAELQTVLEAVSPLDHLTSDEIQLVRVALALRSRDLTVAPRSEALVRGAGSGNFSTHDDLTALTQFVVLGPGPEAQSR